MPMVKNSKMVPYHAASVHVAQEITADCATPYAKYKKVTEYITRNFVYDFVRAVQIPKKNGMPDIARTWTYKMGICLDLASLTTGMLRGIGLDAKMCIGKVDGSQHAWVETRINGKKYRYDRIGRAKVYKTERTY